MRIGSDLDLPDAALEWQFVRSGGPGGQNVNKVATAVRLRVSVGALGLPSAVRERLVRLAGRRMAGADELVISAQRFRTQERNRADALERLAELLAKARIAPVLRVATRPTRSSQVRRVEHKVVHGRTKRLRGAIDPDD